MFDVFLQTLWVWFVSVLNSVFMNYVIPNLQLIVQIVVLVIVGYITGIICKTITVKILTMIGFKKITTRSWTDDILKAVGYRGSIVTLIGDLVKWFVYILILGVIIELIGFPGLFNIFSQIAIFVPRFIAGVLIIVIGFLIADFLGKVFEEAGRRIFDDEQLGMLSGGIAKYSIATISIIMALALIGIVTVSLTIMFAIILTAVVTVLIIGLKDIFPNFAVGVHVKRNFRIGERIRVCDYTGVIEKMEPLYIVLKVGSKSVRIPNHMLVNNPVERLSKK